jgi:hypothetical protein
MENKYSLMWVNLGLIVLFNLLPAYFVLAGRADVFTIVMVYWMESSVIGLFNVLKMAFARGVGSSFRAKAGLITFFIFHYYMFMFAQLVFILSFMNSFLTPKLLLNFNFRMLFWALFAGHAIAFVSDYINSGQFLLASPGNLMFLPYGRVFVQQFVVVLGGFLLMRFNLGTANVFLFVLIATKTVADIGGYILSASLFRTGQSG